MNKLLGRELKQKMLQKVVSSLINEIISFSFYMYVDVPMSR